MEGIFFLYRLPCLNHVHVLILTFIFKVDRVVVLFITFVLQNIILKLNLKTPKLKKIILYLTRPQRLYEATFPTVFSEKKVTAAKGGERPSLAYTCQA